MRLILEFIQYILSSCLALIEKASQVGGMDKKKKHWKPRGDTKKATFRLPVDTLEKLDKLAKAINASKTQVLIDVIDGKAGA